VRLGICATLAAVLLSAPAFAQSYLAKPQVVGGNPGPAHNYVCPNVEAGGALDCYLDAVLHLYTMCRHVKSLEIIEYGYDKSGDGTNAAKSDSCITKQKGNIARPLQSALREVSGSKHATGSCARCTTCGSSRWHRSSGWRARPTRITRFARGSSTPTSRSGPT
jgi:hypothetical protein